MAAELRVIEHRPFGKAALFDRSAADFYHPAVPRIAADYRQTGIDLVSRTFEQLQEIVAIEDQRAGQRIALIVATRLHEQRGDILFADHWIGNAYIDDGKQATTSNLPQCGKGKA